MKKRWMTLLATLVLAVSLVLSGCGGSKSVTLTEYSNRGGTYTISAPEGWTADTSADESMLVLDVGDGSMGVMVQQFIKANVAGTFDTIDAFAEYYTETMTTSFSGSEATGNTVEVTNDNGIEIVKTEEYSITDSGAKGKLLIVYAQTEAAYYAIVFTGSDKQYKNMLESVKTGIKAFKENADAMPEPAPEISDTLKWFNGTYALITERNGADINIVGGYPEGDSSKAMIAGSLESSWDVTDKATADETLEWLLSEGHNKEMQDFYTEFEMASFTQEEFKAALDSSADFTDEEKIYLQVVYDAVSKYGDKAILAWDLSRAMQLSAWYYLAGYYTYEEAMDSSLKIAQQLQASYSSWDDMMQSYLYGFQYWNEDDINDSSSESYSRKANYETLKADAASPFNLDWNMTFEKDW